jgi:predicted metal-dependent peptidase
MIWEKITSPQKRVERAMRKLFQDRRAQFWGTLGLTMGLIPREDIETAATDCVNIYYNPAYIMGLSEDETIGLLAHEISHPALRHMQRLAYLSDHDLANMAADYELNLDLIDAGLTLPDGALIDQRFKGMAAEQIANVLRRENEEDKEQGNTPRHQPQSGNMMEPSNPDGSPMDSEQIAELAEQWETKVNQVLSAARRAGLFGSDHVPTSLQSVSQTRSQGVALDWRQPLRAFIDQLGSVESTWNRLSRRGMAHGMIWQGEEPVRPSRIAWVIDCSGSMDVTKNKQAAIEAQAALDDSAVDCIDVIYTDTRVKDIDTYEIGDTINLRTYTGGGTDFAAVMDHITNGTEDYAAIVFVTDGETTNWGIDPSVPTLWAITGSQRDTDALKPPFGEKLCLYTS